MEENKECEAHLTSAAAFVEGGIQDACDEACSICLEAFSDTDPSTVSEKLPVSHVLAIHQSERSIQQLLEAVERERNFRSNPSRDATIFHHPILGDFELQQLPVGVNSADLEERIIQHLAAAAAMGRARHIARREGHRNRSSTQGRPHFLVFSNHPNSHPVAPASSSPTHSEDGEPAPAIAITSLSPTPATAEESLQLIVDHPVEANQFSASGSGFVALAADHPGSSYNDRRFSNPSSSSTQDRTGPSEFQSFSESLKSRLNAVSMRYKESISKSTRGWKERWFSRNTPISDLGSEVKREVNAGIAAMSHMMEHLETRDRNITSGNAAPINLADSPVPRSNNLHITDSEDDRLFRDSTKASCAAGSSSN